MSVLDKLKGRRALSHWSGRFVVLSVQDGPEDWESRIGSREKISYHGHSESLDDARRVRDYAMTNTCLRDGRRWMIACVVDVIEDSPRAYNQQVGNNGSCPPGAM